MEAIGYAVLQLSIPDGPDLVGARCNGPWPLRIVFVECKTGKGKLRPGQQKFAERWPVKVYLFRSPDDVLEALGG